MNIDKEFKMEMEVRDYECDLADGVNNSVYLNYLEHARHSMLKNGGIDYAELARQKMGLVIVRAELDYIRSLVSGDKFVVKTVINRISKLRFEFLQEIHRISDGQLILKAKILGAPINAVGRPKMPPELESLIVTLCSNV